MNAKKASQLPLNLNLDNEAKFENFLEFDNNIVPMFFIYRHCLSYDYVGGAFGSQVIFSRHHAVIIDSECLCMRSPILF